MKNVRRLLIVGCLLWTRLAGAEETKTSPEGSSSGWMVNAGYFFKDTMFYGSGRGGLHAAIGRIFGVTRVVGLWSETGWTSAGGTCGTVGLQGEEYRTRFSSQCLYVTLGVSVLRYSVPVGVGVYWHDTSFVSTRVTGPLAGVEASGNEHGIGTGIMVNVYIPLGGAQGRDRRRPRLILGYGGFIDWTPVDLQTDADSASLGTVIERKWRPLRGEALRVGLEFGAG